MKRFIKCNGLIINVDGLTLIQKIDKTKLRFVYNNNFYYTTINYNDTDELMNKIMEQLETPMDDPTPYIWNKETLRFDTYSSASNTNGFNKWTHSPIVWKNDNSSEQNCE